MIKHNDKILVVDVEETCWESNLPPEGQQAEIIQIGWAWVELGVTPKVAGKGQVLIKPKQSKISEYCTNLTGITQKMVKSGLPYEQACKYLVHHLGCRSRPWAAWGNDRNAIEGQCRRYTEEDYHGVECKSPFSDAYLNLQLLTAVWIGPDVTPRPGLEEMMKRLTIEPCGPPHRADNDAWMAAKVLERILTNIPS